ncbi:unnamed protein product [Cuscuta epithymum]|uniref:Secreted protein n=1 Tax=Cuscuta epithymum TaxID=186058 RepID=A0AAV0DMX7_9ASTE|nr:unnamed protein product [Cuscuta epithymum]
MGTGVVTFFLFFSVSFFWPTSSLLPLRTFVLPTSSRCIHPDLLLPSFLFRPKLPSFLFFFRSSNMDDKGNVKPEMAKREVWAASWRGSSASSGNVVAGFHLQHSW